MLWGEILACMVEVTEVVVGRDRRKATISMETKREKSFTHNLSH